MEFIKVGKNYLVKGSNGKIVSEKEKLQLENNELKLKNDDCGCSCPDKIKKIAKNRKKIEEINNKNKKKNKKKNNKYEDNVRELQTTIDDFEIIENTALQDEENADDTIKETDNTL